MPSRQRSPKIIEDPRAFGVERFKVLIESWETEDIDQFEQHRGPPATTSWLKPCFSVVVNDLYYLWPVSFLQNDEGRSEVPRAIGGNLPPRAAGKPPGMLDDSLQFVCLDHRQPPRASAARKSSRMPEPRSVKHCIYVEG